MRRRTPEETRVMRATSPVMTVNQLADYLQCHPSTIYRMLHHHDLGRFTVRVGSEPRFIKSAIYAVIAGLAGADFREVGRKPL